MSNATHRIAYIPLISLVLVLASCGQDAKKADTDLKQAEQGAKQDVQDVEKDVTTANGQDAATDEQLAQIAKGRVTKKSVDDVRMGMSYMEVMETLGKPDHTEDLKDAGGMDNGWFVATWKNGEDGLDTVSIEFNSFAAQGMKINGKERVLSPLGSPPGTVE